MNPLRIILAALFVYSVCRATGQLLFRSLALSLRRGERVFLEFVTGAALFSPLVFFLAAVQLVFTSVLLAAGAILLLAAWRFRQSLPEVAGPELPLAWRILFWAPYLTFGILYLIAAMCPEISPDGTGYHVGLVSRYYDHRGFYPIATNIYAGLAEGIEMLFLVAFALGRHSAAAMVHLLFLLTLPFGMLAFARRAAIPRAGVISALLFYLAPVVGRDGTVAYIDVATAAVIFGSFSFLEIWRTERIDRALIPAGILAGFACACKITATPIAVYAIVYVLSVCLARRLPWQRTVRLVNITALGVIALAAPWIVKDCLQFHNPFFPVFNHWFPNPYQYPMVENEMRSLMKNFNGVALTEIPWQATVGGKLSGVLGPVFLLAPLALAGLRFRRGRILLLAFLPVFLPFFTNIGARFLIPSLPFLALAMALGMVAIPRFGPPLGFAVVVLHAGLSWPDFIDRWSPGYQWRIDHMNWRAALRIIPEKTYLEDNWHDYVPGLLLDRFVPPGEKVFSPAMGQMAYQHRELIGTFDSALGRRTFLMFLMAQEKPLASTWNREIHFPATTTGKIRLITRNIADADLRVSEMRFALGKSEIVRQSSWQLTASANPWEVQYAFDNNPVSWWTSGQTVEPGLWLQVDFARPVTLDRVLLSQSTDQRWTSLGISALINGQWTVLSSRESDVEEPPRPSLRMEVRDELKSTGIHWILIPDGNYGAADLLDKAPLWGITQVAMANGFRLWKLN